MPLPDASVDIVFSKDSIVHIPDKEALAADAFRVLRPGGWFVASDWLISHDGEPSPEMADYIAKEDLDFGMASPARYRRALEAAGFVDVSLTNRNPWYRTVARGELARLEGAGRDAFLKVMDEAALDEQVGIWRAMIIVLDSGEHCPHHFRGPEGVASCFSPSSGPTCPQASTPGNCGTRDFDEGTRSIHRIFGLRISEYLRRNSARESPLG